ncbi:NAD(P)/FAD-dependent oxidoreductase [Ottowia thiooxydans]|uniref:NAD(P)/FAD-dependent oxidoreductase n=1 Tax=Ottowia thiooxydans TaxID=219182 RepID=UPI000406CFDC|nr:NAD(P)/FAD-dependent oxidoreductase [Ottowia thiooxydans]
MKDVENERVVIVGGGAGGLELACKLGRKLGKGRVVLVERDLNHIWKPTLHEVAAGTLDMNQEGLSYSMLAYENNFTFVYGAFSAIDHETNEVVVSASEAMGGRVVYPERRVKFSKLCIAVGSTSNYYNTPGAAENTISLNATSDAERFRVAMMNQMIRAEQSKSEGGLGAVEVVIIGGGATGVELAAELREASGIYANYGFEHFRPDTDLKITLLEGSDRILAPLSERISNGATHLLGKRHVEVVTNCRVSQIDQDSLQDSEGRKHNFNICVWAAGIKAPAFLSSLGLPINRLGQLEVTDRLNVKGHDHIYAIGDCASCIQADGKPVPPRAQAAHQQADYVYEAIVRAAEGREPAKNPYRYQDHGSLVSIGTQTSVGSLMGSLTGGTLFVDGLFARWLYISLHLMHHKAILGLGRTVGLAIARALVKRSTALVKLH